MAGYLDKSRRLLYIFHMPCAKRLLFTFCSTYYKRFSSYDHGFRSINAGFGDHSFQDTAEHPFIIYLSSYLLLRTSMLWSMMMYIIHKRHQKQLCLIPHY